MNLDSEALKDLSVQSAGTRTALLKNIYHLKVLHRIAINDWDYIPPSKSEFFISVARRARNSY